MKEGEGGRCEGEMVKEGGCEGERVKEGGVRGGGREDQTQLSADM